MTAVFATDVRWATGGWAAMVDGVPAGTAGLVLRYWVPVLAYAAAIFALSGLSRPEEMVPSLLDEVGDKTWHALEYGVLGVLCYRALRIAAGAWAAARALPLAIIAALLYAVTDEIHQAFVPQRDADVWDLVADGIGATLMTWVWHKLRGPFCHSRGGGNPSSPPGKRRMDPRQKPRG